MERVEIAFAIKLDKIPFNQIKLLCVELGISQKSRNLKEILKKYLLKLPLDEQKRLLQNYFDNRLFFKTEIVPENVKALFIQWFSRKNVIFELKRCGGNQWADKYNIDLNSGYDYENEDDYDDKNDIWIPKDYYHLRGEYSKIQIDIEIISKNHSDEGSLILVRLRKQPPFRKIANEICIMLQDIGCDLIDDRPRGMITMSRRDDGMLFKPDPDNPRRNVPYLELNYLLRKCVYDLSDLLLKNNSPNLGMLPMFQLHSVLDHASSLFIFNLVSKCRVIPAELKINLDSISMLGNTLDLLYSHLGVLRNWEYYCAKKSNEIRNRLYHPGLTSPEVYIDYARWFDYEGMDEFNFALPIPRPIDLKEFLKGVIVFLQAIGLGGNHFYRSERFSFIFGEKPKWEMKFPKKQNYLKFRFMQDILIDSFDRFYNFQKGKRMCSQCGMPKIGIEKPRCPFCCPKCGKQLSAVLTIKYGCGHEFHPIFAIYGSIIHSYLLKISEYELSGEFCKALLIMKFIIDISTAAKSLEGKNYFDVVSKLNEYGINLIPVEVIISDLIKKQGRKAMKILNTANIMPQKKFFDNPPTKPEYNIVKDFFLKVLNYLDTKSLPKYC